MPLSFGAKYGNSPTVHAKKLRKWHANFEKFIHRPHEKNKPESLGNVSQEKKMRNSSMKYNIIKI